MAKKTEKWTYFSVYDRDFWKTQWKTNDNWVNSGILSKSYKLNTVLSAKLELWVWDHEIYSRSIGTQNYFARQRAASPLALESCLMTSSFSSKASSKCCLMDSRSLSKWRNLDSNWSLSRASSSAFLWESLSWVSKLTYNSRWIKSKMKSKDYCCVGPFIRSRSPTTHKNDI